MFYLSKPKQSDFNTLISFFDTLNIKCSFIQRGWSYALCEERIIKIDVREAQTIQELWSIAFHELAHIVCYEERLWAKYHDLVPMSNKEYIRYILKYSLRAERFVDKLGSKLMSAFLPDIPFLDAYSNEEDVAWHRQYLKKLTNDFNKNSS